MPHTRRAVSTSDGDALSTLTGFDPNLARQVNQAEGRIQGKSFTRIHPFIEAVLRPELHRLGWFVFQSGVFR